ncbi:hypothetical protein HanIR_Chr10g0469371 [Helianthus annuus]|nr:hypothetical protein HanIR_Chr10g0469371 [Helianthus annuus]
MRKKNINRIVLGQFTSGKKIFGDVRDHQNIIKFKFTKNFSVTDMSYWQRFAISKVNLLCTLSWSGILKSSHVWKHVSRSPCIGRPIGNSGMQMALGMKRLCQLLIRRVCRRSKGGKLITLRCIMSSFAT